MKRSTKLNKALKAMIGISDNYVRAKNLTTEQTIFAANFSSLKMIFDDADEGEYISCNIIRKFDGYKYGEIHFVGRSILSVRDTLGDAAPENHILRRMISRSFIDSVEA